MLTENRPSDHAAGISRRSFLKGASGIGLFAAAGGAPLLDFFVREAGAESAALVHRWVSSTCQGCTTWCPVQVKIVDGRAVHLRGNPHSLAITERCVRDRISRSNRCMIRIESRCPCAARTHVRGAMKIQVSSPSAGTRRWD